MQKAVVVMPTYDEAKNVKVLIPLIFAKQAQIGGHDLHILVVDDNSPDGTADVVRELMKTFPNLHLMTGEKKGLGEAYKRGMAHAVDVLGADYVLQMDADLQHSPDMLPVFLCLAGYGFSLVIGSRFALGGSTPNFSLRRLLISLVGNWLLRFVSGLPAIRDCTSGYRCIRADLLEHCNLSFLSTKGYSFQSSLLFELIRNKAQVIEVPIEFPDRKEGKSKLGLADQVEFMLNVFRIRFRKSEEFIKFVLVGGSGVVVNLGLYMMLTRWFAMQLELASPIAIESSIISNFFLNTLFTFRNRNAQVDAVRRFFRFHVAAGLAGIVNYCTLLLLTNVFGVWDIASNFVGICCGVLINYFMNSRWTWKEAEEFEA